MIIINYETSPGFNVHLSHKQWLWTLKTHLKIDEKKLRDMVHIFTLSMYWHWPRSINLVLPFAASNPCLISAIDYQLYHRCSALFESRWWCKPKRFLHLSTSCFFLHLSTICNYIFFLYDGLFPSVASVPVFLFFNLQFNPLESGHLK